MCYSCYEDYGMPKVFHENTEELLLMIKTVYSYSHVGGNCHIVLDDWNLEDDSIKWCLEHGIPENYHEAKELQLTCEKYCMELMLSMPLAARATALALHDGYLEPG